MTKNQKTIAIAAAALVALAGVAAASSYLTRQSVEEEQLAEAEQKPAPVKHRNHKQASAANATQPAAGRPACNDHNVVGTVIGGVAGGVVGNQFGRGSGRTVATVGGAAGGAYLGNEYINTRNATCN